MADFLTIAGLSNRDRYHGDLAFIGEDLEALVWQMNAALASVSPRVTECRPRIVGTTLGGVGTYTAQGGWCLKSGRQVMVSGALAWSAHTGTGNMVIAGLPYAAADKIVGAAGYRGVVAIVSQNLTFANQLSGRILAGASEIELVTFSTGAALAAVAMDTAATVNFTAIYLTDEA